MEFLMAPMASLCGNTPETEKKEVPITVPPLIGGPSVDFPLGRIYEASTAPVRTYVMYKHAMDMPALIRLAEDEFRNKNCMLLR
jgi:hypothetical protein